jgi:hypothetical protein
MLKEGVLLLFPNYVFPDGSSKPKFFIVIKEIDDDLIIVTLPSSQDHVPDFAEKDHGCIDIAEAQFNCYTFSPTKAITKCGFKFQKQTFVYGQHLLFENKTNVITRYPVKDVNFRIIGELTDEEYADLYNCIKKSPTVKNKFKRIL